MLCIVTIHIHGFSCVLFCVYVCYPLKIEIQFNLNSVVYVFWLSFHFLLISLVLLEIISFYVVEMRARQTKVFFG